jgi:hypothetical protein
VAPLASLLPLALLPLLTLRAPPEAASVASVGTPGVTLASPAPRGSPRPPPAVDAGEAEGGAEEGAGGVHTPPRAVGTPAGADLAPGTPWCTGPPRRSEDGPKWWEVEVEVEEVEEDGGTPLPSSSNALDMEDASRRPRACRSGGDWGPSAPPSGCPSRSVVGPGEEGAGRHVHNSAHTCTQYKSAHIMHTIQERTHAHHTRAHTCTDAHTHAHMRIDLASMHVSCHTTRRVDCTADQKRRYGINP